jgi:hypothetical protein
MKKEGLETERSRELKELWAEFGLISLWPTFIMHKAKGLLMFQIRKNENVSNNVR